MRTSAPPLLPIFRSELQGRLLALLYARPSQEHSVSELARRLGSHVSTVQREVVRLEEAGILVSHRVGNTRLIRPNEDSSYTDDLGGLVLKAFGPVHVLARALRDVPGVEEAYVFGSWAERYSGIRGPAAGDVDVLVLGKPDRDAIYAAALEAQEQIGLEINITTRSKEAWEADQGGFARSVRSGPLVPIQLESS